MLNNELEQKFRIEVAHVLTSEQLNDLSSQLHKVLSQSVEQVRREAGLNKEWLKKKEAAAYIGISRTTLDDWIQAGLKISLVNGVQLISKKDITEFLVAHRV